MIQRNPNNPLITKNDLKPSIEGLEVVGIFNPGACRVGDEIILLMRVAEACKQEKGWIKVPVMNMNDGGSTVEIISWKKNGRHRLDTNDPRKILIDGKMYLTSLSHLHLARSRDGIHFTMSPEPFLVPEGRDEAFGIEDPRITQINDIFYITYTAVSEDGHGVCLALTQDFENVDRYGMIFYPQNKDACIFPERIANHYAALHRPSADPFSRPSIWYAQSPNLRHWGENSCVLRPRYNRWEQEKIGVGPQPIKTSEGWLLLYHGCGQNFIYSLHLCLLDLHDPRRVLKRGTKPILFPKDKWEKTGFFPNVIFSNGWINYPNGLIQIYYGAADDCICLVDTTLDNLMKYIE